MLYRAEEAIVGIVVETTVTDEGDERRVNHETAGIRRHYVEQRGLSWAFRSTDTPEDDPEYAAAAADLTAIQANPVQFVPVAPPPSEGAAPYTWDVTALPAGTIVTVINEAGEEPSWAPLTDLGEAVTLTDPGIYTLVANSPPPDEGYRVTVEVTSA